MKLHTLMPAALKVCYQQEMKLYQTNLHQQNLSQAWVHLERVHIIGQAYPVEHTLAHWEMLKYGIRNKNLREIAGQLPRLLIGGIKSFIGEIPTGNTGGANIPPLKSLAVPQDIRKMFRDAGLEE